MPPFVSTIVASIASVIVAIVSSNWFSRRMLKHSSTDEILKRLDKIEILTERNTDAAEKLRDADIALLEDRFKYLCKRSIHDGYISTQNLEAIHKLSVPFFEFDDVNGSGHSLLQKVEELPIKEDFDE